MKLDYLELTNFRCFNQFRIDFEPGLTVLIASNGSGKTAVLDAIAVNLGKFVSRFPDVSGIGPKDTDLREDANGRKPPYMRILVALKNGIKWDQIKKRDKTVKKLEDISPRRRQKELYEFVDQFVSAENEGKEYQLPIIAYYGTGRGVFDPPQRRRGFKKQFERFDAYDGALQARANFKRFFEWFYFMEDMERRGKEETQDWDYRQPELDAMRKAIERAVPEFSNPRSKLRPLRLVVDWKHHNKSQSLRIDQLSDGYRTTLAMVMDIASRMAEANPNESDILATEGVVMVDEIEMHLHPAWQQTIISDLQRTFPNVQFIISTHSPQVISSVSAGNIRIIENDNVYTSPAGTKGAEASRILKRVFGIDLRPRDDPNVILLNEYLSMVYQDQWDSREAKNKRRKLDEIYQGEEPALTEADLYIENRKWELADETDM
jgi:predicted ATP-binding protein involved in virulence